jgi:formamidopyrimidine-DNA glycosylase
VPELPEVEAARVLLQALLRRRRIEAVAAVPDPIVYAGVTPRRMAAALRGRRVLRVGRKGKHLWLELDRRPWPVFHFGMTGRFRVYDTEAQRPRFWKLEMRVSSGKRVAFADARRFGRIRLQQHPEIEAPISKLGFDALEGVPDAGALHRLLARRKAPIKAVLLDQAVFAGVGNWVADEILFQARISPHRPAASLTAQEVRALRAKLIAIVAHAVKVGADSDRFPRGWLFHRRWGRDASAVTARDERIRHETIGGRTAAWVPGRQR